MRTFIYIIITYVYLFLSPPVVIQSVIDANSKIVTRDFYHPECPQFPLIASCYVSSQILSFSPLYSVFINSSKRRTTVFLIGKGKIPSMSVDSLHKLQHER